MLTATVNGTEIAYTDSGGDGPPVLLSHGFLMDHTMFDPQLPADAAIPMGRAEALRDGLGGAAELVPVEGASHASNLTRAAQVNQALLGFLRSLHI